MVFEKSIPSFPNDHPVRHYCFPFSETVWIWQWLSFSSLALSFFRLLVPSRSSFYPFVIPIFFQSFRKDLIVFCSVFKHSLQWIGSLLEICRIGVLLERHGYWFSVLLYTTLKRNKRIQWGKMLLHRKCCST